MSCCVQIPVQSQEKNSGTTFLEHALAWFLSSSITAVHTCLKNLL